MPIGRSAQALVPQKIVGEHAVCGDENLNAFMTDAGRAVSVVRWSRADCCDSVVGNGGIGWVLSGVVRKSLILESGQRRIVDLMMPGDFFGLRQDAARRFSFEAAVAETQTARISHQDLSALGETRPSLYRFLYERACQSIARLEDHTIVEGSTRSTQKVAGYLLAMANRLSNQHGGSVVLPMSRYDIADHLGVAVETVSRTITALRQQGIIELQTPRRFSIKNSERLADGNSE